MTSPLVFTGEECPVCYKQSEFQRLSPCGHGLCSACVHKLEQFAAEQEKERRCPLCRQVFLVLQRAPSLVDTCVKRLEWRLPKAHQMPKLAPELRARFFAGIKNRRMLHGDVLLELLRGLQLDELSLQDACNMTAEDIAALMPILAEPYPKVVVMRNVPLLNDEALVHVLHRVAPRLERLDISGSEERLEGTSLKEFANALPCLSTLIMADCHRMLSLPVTTILAGCAKSLKVVDLSGCRKLGDEAVLSLASCTQLQTLSVRGFWKLQTRPVVKLLEACTLLQGLDLTFCSRVSGPEVFRAIAGYSTELRELLVGAVDGIDDDAVLAFALSTAGASMQSLAINRSDITARALKAICTHCPRLRRLDVSDCHELSEDSVVDTIMEMPNLRILQVKYCRGISTQMQLYVAQLLAGRALGIDDDAPPLKRSVRGAGQGPSSPSGLAGGGALDSTCCCSGDKEAGSSAVSSSASSSSASHSSTEAPPASSSSASHPSPTSSSTGSTSGDGASLCSHTPASAASSNSGCISWLPSPTAPSCMRTAAEAWEGTSVPASGGEGAGRAANTSSPGRGGHRRERRESGAAASNSSETAGPSPGAASARAIAPGAVAGAPAGALAGLVLRALEEGARPQGSAVAGSRRLQAAVQPRPSWPRSPSASLGCPAPAEPGREAPKGAGEALSPKRPPECSTSRAFSASASASVLLASHSEALGTSSSMATVRAAVPAVPKGAPVAAGTSSVQGGPTADRRRARAPLRTAKAALRCDPGAQQERQGPARPRQR